MNEVILAKYGELALKGLNKSSFESVLTKTVSRRVARAGNFRVRHAQSTIYVEPQDENCDIGFALDMMGRVFGIAALDRAAVVEKDLDTICRAADSYLSAELAAAHTFKVSAKRADKKFPLTSMELAAKLGEYLLERHPKLKADMQTPQLDVNVEIRDFGAYIHKGKIAAAGGMPTGTSGRAAFMLSGGIDSPVAAYMMAKRGLDLVAVHFQSPPYTSERALAKVIDLAQIVSCYVGNIAVFAVPFTEIQLALRDHCPEELFTVLMRRSMVRVTDIICAAENCHAMITGESLAQVASQTLLAINCTDAAAKLPVLRPLIGMDKNEIVDIARRIGTFETSILPYEDCCTIFTPKHPKTKPRIADVEAAESACLNLSEMEAKAAAGAELHMVHFYDKL